MKRHRFTEEQIIGVLKKHEAGISVAGLCRTHSVSDASVYKRQARDYRQLKWNGVHLQCHPELCPRAPDRLTLHRGPSKPTQNAFIESFNGRLRDEFLNQTFFPSLAWARAVLATWWQDYNNERPPSLPKPLLRNGACRCAI